MSKEAIFMLGLPGAGKTFQIDELQKKSKKRKYIVVSADIIRVNHPDYNPEDPTSIHEECVSLAEQSMYDMGDQGHNLIMDGGGINNSYTKRIIENMKLKGYRTKVLFYWYSSWNLC